MIVPPIIVVEDHDFAFFPSEEAVSRYIEPWYPVARAIQRSGWT